MRYKAHGQ
jgi:cell division cycle 20-like protein 1 (cofactor of APC complex)